MWFLGAPCHHPKWPRYCNKCRQLAAGMPCSKVISERREAWREERLTGDRKLEVIIHPEVKPVHFGVSPTICWNCKICFIKGSYPYLELKIKDSFGLTTIVVEEYLCKSG